MRDITEQADKNDTVLSNNSSQAELISKLVQEYQSFIMKIKQHMQRTFEDQVQTPVYRVLQKIDVSMNRLKGLVEEPRAIENPLYKHFDLTYMVYALLESMSQQIEIK